MSHWTEVTVDGVTVDLLSPATGPSATSAIVLLPDYDGRSIVQHPALAAAFEQTSLLVLSPRVSQSWWTTRPDTAKLTAPPLEFVRTALCGFASQEWGIEPPGIGLSGIGTGGQGALQVAYRNARSFPVVAAIAPAIDFHVWYGRGLDLDQLFDSEEAARQQTVTLHLHPLNWPRHQYLLCDPADPFWFEGCERLASKLVSSGIPFEREFGVSADGNRDRYVELVSEQFVRFFAERLVRS